MPSCACRAARTAVSGRGRARRCTPLYRSMHRLLYTVVPPTSRSQTPTLQPPTNQIPLCFWQAKEEMRAKEALLKNFFANVEVVQRSQKVAATAQRWEVRPGLAGAAGVHPGVEVVGAWLAVAVRMQVPALLPGAELGGALECEPCHPTPPQEEERQLQRELDGIQRRVHEALCDNINTQVAAVGARAVWRAFASGACASTRRHLSRHPGYPPPPSQAAMGALCDLVKASNIYLAARADGAGPQPQPLLLRAAAAYVTRILSVFGLAAAPGDFLGFAEPGAAGGAADEAMHAVLDDLCSFRWVGGHPLWAGDLVGWPAPATPPQPLQPCRPSGCPSAGPCRRRLLPRVLLRACSACLSAQPCHPISPQPTPLHSSRAAAGTRCAAWPRQRPPLPRCWPPAAASPTRQRWLRAPAGGPRHCWPRSRRSEMRWRCWRAPPRPQATCWPPATGARTRGSGARG